MWSVRFRPESRVAPIGARAEEIAACLRDDARFDQLIRSCQLDVFETLALLIALAPEIDLRYQRIYAYLQDDVTKKRPTVDLILNLLCANDTKRFAQRRAFASNASLLRNDLVQRVSDPNYVCPPLLAEYVKPDEQIVRLLLGDSGLDSRLRASCRLMQPQAALSDLIIDENTKRQLLGWAHETAAGAAGVCLWLCAPDEMQRSKVGEALAHEAGRALLILDASRVQAPDIEEVMRRAVRDAALRPAILYIELSDAWHSESRVAAQFTALARERGCSLIVGSMHPVPTAMLGIARPVSLPLPTRNQRAECWRRALQSCGVECDEQNISILAARFHLSGSQIAAAVADACQRSIGRPLDQDLRAAARAQCGDALATVADKVVPRATWEDIVLPQDAIEQLRELCQRVDFQDRVFEDWGFARKMSRGRGATALFCGGSGTGKTMAAEVIANALASICIASISRASSASTSARPRRISVVCSQPRTVRTRFFYSTRRTRCSASAPTSRMHTTATPISRPPICCKKWRNTRASPSNGGIRGHRHPSPPTLPATSMRRSRGGWRSSCNFRFPV
ncbi:MAG: hypothetical protein WDO56_07920 [Gammaproteobacteria bacterium]